MISRVESVEGATDEYHREFPDLFNGLGKMEGPYTITLKENAQPFAVNVPRRVALPLMEKTKTELKRMEASDANTDDTSLTRTTVVASTRSEEVAA